MINNSKSSWTNGWKADWCTKNFEDILVDKKGFVTLWKSQQSSTILIQKNKSLVRALKSKKERILTQRFFNLLI